MSKTKPKRSYQLESLTPIVICPDVDKALRFYCDVLGFKLVDSQVREGRTSFAILQQGGVEWMLQSQQSLRNESPSMITAEGPPLVASYVDVDDARGLYTELESIEGLEIVVPLRMMPHGLEFYIRDPAGHLIGFAEPGAAP